MTRSQGLAQWQIDAEAAATTDPGAMVAPEWDTDLVPMCAKGKCPAYDGKCDVLGFLPYDICEPVVRAMARMLEEKR